MEMSNEDRAEYTRDLHARILAHPGRLAADRWRSIRLVHTALLWNEEFLVRHIDFTGPEGELRAIETIRDEDGRRQKMQQFWLFLFAFLANYTAMNSTLVDHVRGLDGLVQRTRRDLGGATASVGFALACVLRSTILRNPRSPRGPARSSACAVASTLV